MVYAEIFMILEPDGTRNAEMSRLLFDSYKKHLIEQEGGPLAGQFCDDVFYIAVMALVLDNPTAPTFPFEMLYDRGVIAAVESETQVDLASLNRIRTRFFSFCWKNMADIQKSLETYDYPDLSSFFSFVREVEQAAIWRHIIIGSCGKEIGTSSRPGIRRTRKSCWPSLSGSMSMI